MLDVSIDIGQDLARVILVGEPVDDRDAGMRREAFDDGLLEGANHDHVDHSRDDPSEVLDRLAARELCVAAIEVDGNPTELVHAGLERDARARGSLLEHHRQGSIAQRLVDLVALETFLDPARAVEQVVELVAAEIAELQEMLGDHAYDRGGFRIPDCTPIRRFNLY